MANFTRRDFLKKSSVAAGVLGVGSSVDLWAGPETSLAGTTLYVATNGDDSWSGKLAGPNAAKTDGPFATLGRARDAVRELRTKTNAVIVMVRGGKYYLEQALVFGSVDSGSQQFPISYRDYTGEKVVLSGGKRITGWKPYKGQILQAVLPGAKGGKWKFRQLFLNGEPQRRSRYPKYDASNPLYGGWVFAEGPASKQNTTAFIYKPNTFPRPWAKPTNGEVVMFPGTGWVDAILPIKSIDEKTRTITSELGYRNPDIAPWYVPDSFRPGDRFRVENLLEDLTEPGEWCLDSDEGILYFWPPSGQLKPTDAVVAPVLGTLVDIDGASWLKISGFTFTETDGGDDLHRFGLDGYGAMYPNQGWKYCGEALHMKDAEYCVIENNLFYAVGGNAIYLERYNARNLIRRNEISYAGANGVCLLGNHTPPDSVSQPMRGGRQPLPMYNEVTDNYIHHCGAQNKYVAGVFLGVSDGNLVAHNRFEYLPHHAINLGLNGYGRNILEYNEIRQVCLELKDNGAINCWMDDPASDERAGHIIRFNLMTDVKGCSTDREGHIMTPDGWANGIYLDNNSSNCLIQSNIIVRSSAYGIFIHGGQHNAIENNIIVDATTSAPGKTAIGAGQVGYASYLQSSFLSGNRFCNNILYYQKGKSDAPVSAVVIHPGAAPYSNDRVGKSEMFGVISESQGNVFFRSDSGDYIVTETGRDKGDDTFVTKTLSFEEWQKLGFDLDSVAADPLFLDAARDDFRLKSDSPAIRLGFVPIDMTKIGIRKRA